MLAIIFLQLVILNNIWGHNRPFEDIQNLDGAQNDDNFDTPGLALP